VPKRLLTEEFKKQFKPKDSIMSLDNVYCFTKIKMTQILIVITAIYLENNKGEESKSYYTSCENFYKVRADKMKE